MKVVSSQEMIQLEKQAYQKDYSEATFMKQAGLETGKAIHQYIETSHINKNGILLCGKGNNTGDGFVAATYLLKNNYQIYAFLTSPFSTWGILTQSHFLKFLKAGGIAIELLDRKDFPFPKEGFIIDAIFGTGFHGVVNDPYQTLIHQANTSQLPIFSIDIPSGLNGTDGSVELIAIHAKMTFYLGLPKIGFFLNEGWNHCGKLVGIDFGLPIDLINHFDTFMEMTTHAQVKDLLPKIVPNRHKYEVGCVVGLACSAEMPGAGVLSALGAFKAGAGIVKLLYPLGIEAQLSSSPYEIIKIGYSTQNFKEQLSNLNHVKAYFCGPGLGTSEITAQILLQFLTLIQKPCIIDADALNLMALHGFQFPFNSIITPHAGEMIRLLKANKNIIDEAPPIHSKEFLDLCQIYVNNKKVTLVLKGGPTFIFHPETPLLVCPFGDPGMATAGSGDVLTGIIAALLAQGLSTREASILGVYLHGIAGEIAAKELTSYCLMATDIINHLPKAIKSLIS